MGVKEALEIIDEEIMLWARILGKFYGGGYWYNKGFKLMQALNMAKDALKKEMEKEMEE